jgi:hypothetical protein
MPDAIVQIAIRFKEADQRPPRALHFALFLEQGNLD